MPEPSRIMLPLPPESALDEIEEGQPREGDPFESVNPSLRKLQAATYQGTFLRAYSLLTEIAASIGWDQLLRIRSQVFVMEEEYRSERQNTSSSKPQAQNASTTALRAPSPGMNGSANPANDENHTEKGDGESEDDGEVEASKESALNGDGPKDPSASDDSIEKPEHTIASEVVKAVGEDVSV